MFMSVLALSIIQLFPYCINYVYYTIFMLSLNWSIKNCKLINQFFFYCRDKAIGRRGEFPLVFYFILFFFWAKSLPFPQLSRHYVKKKISWNTKHDIGPPKNSKFVTKFSSFFSLMLAGHFFFKARSTINPTHHPEK